MERKEAVPPDQFFALDLRVGRVVRAEPFPAARNPSLIVVVDFGLAGVLRTSAQITNYRPDELVGRLVIGAINLGEKRIAGFSSQFLLLGAIGPDGTVRLLRPDEGAAAGESVA